MANIVKANFANSKINNGQTKYAYNSLPVKAELSNNDQITYSPISPSNISKKTKETISLSLENGEIYTGPDQVYDPGIGGDYGISKYEHTGVSTSEVAKEATVESSTKAIIVSKVKSVFKNLSDKVAETKAKIKERVHNLYDIWFKKNKKGNKYFNSDNDITAPNYDKKKEVTVDVYYPYGKDGEVTAPGYTHEYFYDENGNVIGILKNGIYQKIEQLDDYFKINYYKYNKDTNTLSPISIFDESNLESGQYGGNQADFANNWAHLTNDKVIWQELTEHFPVSDFEDYDDAMHFYNKYMHQINASGCGYVSVANSVFSAYTGREEEFYKTFGYPMYTVNNYGDVDFNYEYLELDLFNHINAESVKESYLNGEIKFSPSEGRFIDSNGYPLQTGTSDSVVAQLVDYLNEKGVDCTCSYTHNINNVKDTDSAQNRINNGLQLAYRENDAVLIGALGYDLYDMDGELVVENGGCHAMQLVGFTEDGMPIVSSWGDRFILDVNGALDAGNELGFGINIINFN